MKNSPLSIEELLLSIRGFFHRTGFHYERYDLPYADYRIDVFACNRRKRLTAAAILCIDEDSFSKAAMKAEAFQECSDFVYIACPHKFAAGLNRLDFIESGVGLLSIQNSTWCSELVMPKRKNIIEATKEDLFNFLIGNYSHVEEQSFECNATPMLDLSSSAVTISTGEVQKADESSTIQVPMLSEWKPSGEESFEVLVDSGDRENAVLSYLNEESELDEEWQFANVEKKKSGKRRKRKSKKEDEGENR